VASKLGKEPPRLRRSLSTLIAEVLESLDIAAHGEVAQRGEESFIQFLVPIPKSCGSNWVSTRVLTPRQSQEQSNAIQQFV